MADFRENPIRSGQTHSTDDASLDLIEAIKQLAIEGFRDKTRYSYDELLFALRRWWCHHYKRPYKDPLFESYTIEELLFEYYDIEGQDEKKSVATEKMIEEDRDWAAEEEAKELAELEAAALAMAAAPKSDTIPVAKDDDAAWAAKHDPQPMVNPTGDQVAQGGEIAATFGG